MLAYFRSIFQQSSDISEEKIEEYKMLSGFAQKDIVRLRKVFLDVTNGSEIMTKSVFKEMDAIALNPLNDRICVCFGLQEDTSTIDFEAFLIGVAAFNAPGRGEVKLKTAFKIQDFDNDGYISKSDLTEYLKRITTSSFNEKELTELVNEVFRETSSDLKQEQITFADFQRVVILLDFQAKINLPI